MDIPILYEILAHLDFLLRGPKTTKMQDPAHGKHKNKILVQIEKNMGGRFTADEIEAQLLESLRLRDFWPEDLFKLLLQHGSSELELDSESKMSIEGHLKIITLNSAMNETPRRERLRSVKPVSVKAQRRNTSTALSDPLPSFYNNVPVSKINKGSAISKSKMSSKVRNSKQGERKLLTLIAKPHNTKRQNNTR
jgi:hypothetical protein